MTAFVRVVETGSFTRAALTLDVPKPTVSRLVQRLETQLRVQLIHRSRRALTLTPEGENYYARVVSLLAELEDIESGARDSLAQPTGTIKVEASIAIANMVLMPALPLFYATYPGINIDLSCGNRDVDVVAEGIDCAIRTGPIADESLVSRRIGYLHFVSCATPDYIARLGFPARPEDLLVGHKTIGMVSTRIGHALPFAFCKDGQRLEMQPAHILRVNDTNAYVAAALAGLGIVQAPSISVQALIDDGQLVEMLKDWDSDSYQTSVVYAPNRFLSAKVRVFVDWLVALFAQHPTLGRRSRSSASGQRTL